MSKMLLGQRETSQVERIEHGSTGRDRSAVRGEYFFPAYPGVRVILNYRHSESLQSGYTVMHLKPSVANTAEIRSLGGC